MDKIRISAVKYANTYPFIYGLTESGFDKKVIIETDHPADCAKKLIEGRADIGLVPVAILPLINNYQIVGDYCIGSDGPVRTVMLLSNCQFNDIRSIILDYRSRTSVNLVKVLAKHKWKIDFTWINTSGGFDFLNIPPNHAVVLIGDQCFEYEKKFRFGIDLSEEWKEYTGLPFVFAAWAANKPVGSVFKREFNDALRTGVVNIPEVVKRFSGSGPITGKELEKYLTENIDFYFNEEKKKGLNLFLELLKTI